MNTLMASQISKYDISERTKKAIGFDRLWQQIYHNCLTSYGRALVEENPFLSDVEAIETKMAQVLAAKTYLRDNSPALLGSVQEIRVFLKTAQKAEILSAADLKEVVHMPSLLLSRIQPALKAGQASAELMQIVDSLHDWHDYALDIVRCFDEHGQLLSTASRV